MSTHPPASIETYREKAVRKFKQQPLVPVGAPSLTVHSRSILIDQLTNRSGCHDGRARSRNDEDAQGSIALVEQLAARPYRRTGVHSCSRCSWLMGIRHF